VDGFRAAVLLVLGIETGLYTWVIASALGLAVCSRGECLLGVAVRRSRSVDHLAGPDPGCGGQRVVPAARDICWQGKNSSPGRDSAASLGVPRAPYSSLLACGWR